MNSNSSDRETDTITETAAKNKAKAIFMTERKLPI